ncbi:MAG: T9SS type A sorting domain-containing protein [Bacteroidales bacterium]
MKTLNTIKTSCLAVLLLLSFSFMAMNLSAQEGEKKLVKIKMVKDVNGTETIMDTTFEVSGLEELEGIEGIDAIIGDELLKDLDIRLKELDENMDVDVDVISLDTDSDPDQHTFIIKTNINEGIGDIKQIETIDLVVEVADSTGEAKIVKMTMDGESQAIFISDDEEIREFETEDGQKTILIKKSSGEENDILVMSGDDLQWESELDMDVEVIDVEDGKKVIVKDENGDVKEYIIEDGKGAYFIDEDGIINKIEDDKNVSWNEEGGRIFINIDDEKDGNVVVIKSVEGLIDSEDLKNEKNIFIHKDVDAEDKEIFVQVIKKKDGDEVIEIKSKVIILKLDEDETKKLEDAGVKVAPASDENKLEVESLKFYPNPTDGKFNLKFNIAEKGTTEVKIYDLNGKEVYREKLKNFEGQYEKEIDLTGEQKGTYFLHIQQGEKISTKKIILE